MRGGTGLLTLACLLALVACGADPDDSISGSTTAAPLPVSDVTYPANGEQAAVLALDNNFIPRDITVSAGTEVVFTNNGRNDHNVVPADDPGATTWGVLEAAFAPKGVYARVFDRPGTYVYFCTIHGTAKAGMFGSITVTEP